MIRQLQKVRLDMVRFRQAAQQPAETHCAKQLRQLSRQRREGIQLGARRSGGAGSTQERPATGKGQALAHLKDLLAWGNPDFSMHARIICRALSVNYTASCWPVMRQAMNGFDATVFCWSVAKKG